MKQEKIDISKYTLGIDPYDKQETLEEAAERYCLINNIPIDQMIVKTDRSCEFKTPITMFIDGAKWQAEKMYSEEEVLELLITCKNKFGGSGLEDYTYDDEVKEWFELNKKK